MSASRNAPDSHGLVEAVREALQQSPHVRGWENGLDSEGGEGVTIAHMLTG